jgi:hypothetical protein
VARSEKPLLNRRLDESWEGIGPVPNMPGLQFASRLMVRSMPLMNFPRYVFRVSRDFFYLTLRRLLPADPLSPLAKGGDSDGKWKSDGIPQHGWPLAAVETALGLDANEPATRARLIMVDPRMVRPSRMATGRAVLTAERPRSAGTRVLWYRDRTFTVSEAAPDGAEVVSYGDALASVQEPRSMACTVDGGMLVFIELEGESTAGQSAAAGGARKLAGTRTLERLLERVGCRSIIAFESGLGLHPGAPETENSETHRGGRKRLSVPVTPVVLERAEAPGARRIFKETPVLPPEKWAIAQSRKVPYTGRRRSGPLPVGAAGPGGARQQEGHL